MDYFLLFVLDEDTGFFECVIYISMSELSFFHQSRGSSFFHARFTFTPHNVTLFQKGCSQIVLFCQFFNLLNTLETSGISEYIKLILLVRSLCFRHLNTSGHLFIGAVQQCLSLLGSLFCVFPSKFMLRNLSLL